MGAPGPELRAFVEREDAPLAAATELNVETWLGPEADDHTRTLVRQMQRRAFELDLAAGEFGEPEQDGGAAAELAAVTARTLAVSGRHGFPDFRAVAAGLPREIAGAVHRELDWAGHLPSLERPDEVTALLLDFLAARR